MSLKSMSSWRQLTLTATALTLAVALGCSKQSNQAIPVGMGLIGKPTGELKIEDMAKRYRGQTEFLNPYQSRNFRAQEAMAAPGSATGYSNRPSPDGLKKKLGRLVVYDVSRHAIRALIT
jgi:hypothetical protein